MLRRSFLHMTGIGSRTERRLWGQGLWDWDHCRQDSGRLGAGLREKIMRAIDKSQQALDCGDARFFAQRLPANQLWRLYPEFKHSCLFFDIETTGLGSGDDYVTTIATFDGKELRTFVYDQNLDEFPDYLANFALIVSYNGKCFDIPFLRRHFGRLYLPAAHIDLRYVLRGLGYGGGLKICEQSMGLRRPSGIQDVDGYMAVLLWAEHLNGTPRALDSLLCYNAYDAVNLRWLLQQAYNLAVAKLPLEVPTLRVQPRPRIAFTPDARLIRSLLGR